MELINTLNEVTEGKIFVEVGSDGVERWREVEKARLTQMLAKMKEDEGKVDEAAGLMQEVQARQRRF